MNPPAASEFRTLHVMRQPTNPDPAAQIRAALDQAGCVCDADILDVGNPALGVYAKAAHDDYCPLAPPND